MASPLIEQIYEKILELIVHGHYGPGDKLPSENELSERYGVSRNTVRAALNKLNVLGFTETKHGGGTYVCRVGNEVYMNFFVPAILMEDDSLLDVLEFRQGIEVQAVRLAAERADETDIAALRRLRDEAAALEQAGDLRGLAENNTAFHEAIAKASHNSMLSKMMDIISSIITLKMQDFLQDQGGDIDSGFYHNMVLECIVNRKPEEAALLMEKHMSALIDRVQRFNERSGEQV